MRKNKKEALSGVAAPERAAETRAIEQTASASVTHSTTSSGGGQMGIADLLMVGEENAITMRDLTAITGLRSRDIRRRIQRERLAGVPILSDNVSGYFLPANDGERRRFIASMRGRAREILAVAAAVEGGGESD